MSIVRPVHRSLLFALGLIPSALFAAPSVVGISNSAILPASWLRSPLDRSVYSGRLSPGLPATVVCSNWTGIHGKATVQVGGRPAAVLSVVPDDDGVYLNIQLPVELAAGPTTLVVTDDTGSSDPFPITLTAYAPILTGISRSAPAAFPQISCGPVNTPAPGELLIATAVGLGPTDPAVSTGVPAPASPLARSVTPPNITVGGRAVEVVDSVLMPGEVGLYRVSFRLPSGDGWPEFVLSAGGVSSNPMVLPVGKTIEDWAPGAPEEIRSAYQCGGLLTEERADGTADVFIGDSRNPPTALGGVTVKIKDAAGVERMAPLLQVAPHAVTYVVPAGSATGSATTIISGRGGVFTAPLAMQTVAPQVLIQMGSLDFDGVPAGLVVRVRDGVQTVERILDISPTGSRVIPIDLGLETDQVSLTLFGTGLRFRSGLANVSVRIGGVDAPVDYAGPQNEFAGLDQINVRLPRSLAGRGAVPVQVIVDGRTANGSSLTFK